MRTSTLCLLYLFVLLPCILKGQESENCDCNEELKIAKEISGQNRFSEVIDLLSDCLTYRPNIRQEKGVSRCFGNDKIQASTAYRLVVDAYLGLEQREQALFYLRMLLKLRPEYPLDTLEGTEPPGLIRLYHSLQTDPLMYIGVSGGPNFATTSVSKFRSIGTLPNDEAEWYSWQPSFQVGASVSIPLASIGRICNYITKSTKQDETTYPRKVSIWTRKVRLQLGAAYTRYVINYESEPLTSLDTRLNFIKIEVRERQHYFRIPLLLTLDTRQKTPYNFYQGKNPRVYLFLGGHASILLGATLLEAVRPPNITLSENSIPQFSSYRTKCNWGLMAGAGIKFKTGKNFIYLNAKYSFLARTINEGAFQDNQLTSEVGFIDSDIRLHQLAVEFAFEWTWYGLRWKEWKEYL